MSIFIYIRVRLIPMPCLISRHTSTHMATHIHRTVYVITILLRFLRKILTVRLAELEMVLKMRVAR